MIGNALNLIFLEKLLKREDLFIILKIIPSKDINALEEVKKILQLLNLNSVDLLVIHWPFLTKTTSTTEKV